MHHFFNVEVYNNKIRSKFEDVCHLDLLFKVTELFITIYLVIRISQEQFNIGAPFLQGRCMTTKSRSSSKMGHLDLLFKVTELFIEYSCYQDISMKNSTLVHHFFSGGV